MQHRKNPLLHRVCRNCGLSYSSEAPGLLTQAQRWPTRCPGCGKVEMKVLQTKDVSEARNFAAFGEAIA